MLANERGFLEAPGLVLLVLLSAQLGVLILVWQSRLEKTREHHKQVLCLKEAILASTQMARQIGLINRMLAAGKVGQGIGLFFPGVGWLASVKWEKAKKALMALQEAAWLKRQQVMLQGLKRGCRFTPAMLLTPYKHPLKFQRTLDVTDLRSESESWWFKTPLSFFHVSWQLSSPQAVLRWEVK
jgi:hypothetical protein